MKIFIKKNGSLPATVLGTLANIRNAGQELIISSYLSQGEKDKYHVTVQSTDSTKALSLWLGCWSRGITKRFMKFIEVNLQYFKEDETHMFWELPSQEYSMHLGKEYGFPSKPIKGLEDFPPLTPKFIPDDSEYKYVSFGNRFNGGHTIHPTDEWKPEKLVDATGEAFTTEYRSPGHIDGYGSGFKGGFYIVKE